MKVTFRNCQRDDRAAVLHLHRVALEDVGAFLDHPGWDADLRDVGEHYQTPGGCFLVAEDERGEIVAMGALRIRDAAAGEIKRMRVSPRCRRCGLGTAILERLEAHARRLGLQRLALDTTTRQVGAQRLYEKHGYRVTGTTRIGPFDVLLYEKDLQGEPTR